MSCYFGASDPFLGTPCAVVPAAAAPMDASGRRLESVSVWSFDTGGDSPAAQHLAWMGFVEVSPLFRALLTSEIRPLGYGTAQESVE